MADWSDVFSDFAITTEDTYLKDAGGLLNEASTRTHLLSMGLKGSNGKGIKTLQGGENIKEQLFLDYTSLAANWSPTQDEMELPNPQFIQEHGIPWRFTATPLTWSDVEVELQADTTADGVYRKLNDLYKAKEAHCIGQKLEYMDGLMTATPSHSLMEASGALNQYSLPSIITEEGSGRVPTIGWSGTSFQGVDDAAWANQIETYSHIEGATTPGSDLDLFDAFESMLLLTEFQQYPMNAVGDPSQFGPVVNILCSRWGRRLYKAALKKQNDQLVTSSRQDPAYMSPEFAGVPIKHVERLGTNDLYADGSGTTYGDETEADVAGPRFMFWNTEYACPIFHTTRYFHRKKASTWAKQPYRNAIWIDTWWNIFCRSKRRQGIVSPSSNIGAANGVAA